VTLDLDSLDPRAPIGVFDSGLGGLTVVCEMLRHLPNERIVYVGDTAHVPYGGRPLDEIRGFATAIVSFLVESAGCKAVVMACNISSAVALDRAVEQFPAHPIVGMVRAGARAAAEMAGGGPIAVLATEGTVRSGAYARAIMGEAPGTEVTSVPCPLFVPLVESGRLEGPDAEAAARTYLDAAFASPEPARIVILGCTHYPFLLPTLTRIAGPEIAFVDPAGEAVRELACRLDRAHLGAAAGTWGSPEHRFYATGDPAQFAAGARAFLGSGVAGGAEPLRWVSGGDGARPSLAREDEV
jgi:glutamate racemase